MRKERVVVSHPISPEVIRFGEQQDKPIKTHLFSLFLIFFIFPNISDGDSPFFSFSWRREGDGSLEG